MAWKERIKSNLQMNKIKPKKVKEHRLPTAPRVIQQRLKNHMENVYLATAYMSPSLTEEEKAKFAFEADNLMKQISQAFGPRARLVIPMMMHFRNIDGLQQHFGELADGKVALPHTTTDIPEPSATVDQSTNMEVKK